MSITAVFTPIGEQPPPPPAPHTVAFNSNGGSSVPSQTITQGEKAAQPANPTRSGYAFDGWYSNSGLTTAWDFDANTVSANTTLYAKWTVNYAETISIPVTFYDFHSDRSNPEFEQPHRGGRMTGLVAPTLDSDGKPQPAANPPANSRAYGVAHWFREWDTYTAGKYGKGKFVAPSYSPTCTYQQANCGNEIEFRSDVTYNGDVSLPHDTSFINKVIRNQSLTFTLAAGGATTGMYQFSSNSFFPLDGLPGTYPVNEWVSTSGGGSHNYSFTMEMAFEFQYRAGMTFEFYGDDDLWAFIDNNLVLDIGGIHEQVRGSFSLDNVLSGQAVGSKHMLRVFYAERHTTASTILIQTNILR
jgi:fibro-slime domain-containing protein/uncharacterized repeat protein (TIGR02543 family)